MSESLIHLHSKNRLIWKLNKRQFYEWTIESFTCLIYLLIINMLVHSERKSDIYVNRCIIYWFIQNNESLRKKHHYLFVTQRCATVLFWLCFHWWIKKKCLAIQSKFILLLYNIRNVSNSFYWFWCKLFLMLLLFHLNCFFYLCRLDSLISLFFSFMALTMSICQFSKQSTCNVLLPIYMCFMSLCVSFDCMIFNMSTCCFICILM